MNVIENVGRIHKHKTSHFLPVFRHLTIKRHLQCCNSLSFIIKFQKDHVILGRKLIKNKGSIKNIKCILSSNNSENFET